MKGEGKSREELKVKSFVLDNPVKVVFGIGEIKSAGEEAKRIGKKAIIVTGKSSAKKAGILDKLTKSLEESGVGSVVYSYISPNPKVHEVNEAAELAYEDECDLVLGLGGGSAMDAAKGVAIVAKSGGSIWDYIALPEKKAEQVKEALPIMLIPTLAATGSEGNPAAVFSNTETNEKAAIYNPGKLYPKVSIVDPELTLSVPQKPTAEGVMDVIVHVLEEYLTGEDDCGVQDRFTEGIITECIDNGKILMENLEDINARANISAASTIALMGVPNSGRAGMWVVHPVEHAVSGLFDHIAHASGIAALLPAYLRFLGINKPAKVIQLSKRVFNSPEDANDEEHIELCVEGFRQVIKELGLKDNLKDLGIKEDEIEKIADKLMAVSGMPWPKMDRKGLISLLKSAY
jgi:alcohol dehydrogenase YqhD (iron-dependent ADH family)